MLTARSKTFSSLAAVLPALLWAAAAHADGIFPSYHYFDLYVISGPSGYTLQFSQSNTIVAGQAIATGYQYTGSVPTNQLALLYNVTGTPSVLNPNGIPAAVAGTDGTQQVGTLNPLANNPHAALWSGTAASAVDLNPAGYGLSCALGVGGNQQVGWGYPDGSQHALLWTGTAGSAVDLQPNGFTGSVANGTNGHQQVGYGTVGTGQNALLWNGTAASAVNLNPAGYTGSVALVTNGSQQVGYGFAPFSSQSHALFWNGTAASAVDLNPAGFSESGALGTNGIYQVGAGTPLGGGLSYAMIWDSTPLYYENLGGLLPSSKFKSSQAISIDAAGDVFGFAMDANGETHAIEWTTGARVPEPGSDGLLAMGVLSLLTLRPRGRWRPESLRGLNPAWRPCWPPATTH